jgi:hypothetical protein
MPATLTFVIPVRHPQNAKNWQTTKKNLSEVIRSISLQDSSDWQAVIVANKNVDLPQLPERFSVAWVNFPPNKMHEKGSMKQEDFYDAFRWDKGRRVLAGLLHAKPKGHVMIVDDDDFVSSKLTSFVAKHKDDNGWFLGDGYIWSENQNFLYTYDDFSNLCGTSHIIRADLYNIPETMEDATEEYVKRWLGSHIFIHTLLDQAGTPLKKLPFVGAVYRVGHSGAHSKSANIFRQYFLKKSLLKRPWEFCRRLMRLRLLSPSIRNEFFGRA